MIAVTARVLAVVLTVEMRSIRKEIEKEAIEKTAQPIKTAPPILLPIKK